MPEVWLRTSQFKLSPVPEATIEFGFSGENIDTAAPENVELVGALNVLVERRSIELCKNVNFVKPGIEAVADGDVDQAIFAGKRNRRLTTSRRKRVETGAATAAHDNTDNFRGCHNCIEI
jgi:hypothetical protein